jgi:cellulose 1,4-beta-cellobiosidase
LTGPTRVSLTWQAARSPVGVAGYEVYRNGDRLGSTTSTTYVDSAVTPGARYTYTVRAFDAAGKSGLRSRRVRVALP